MGVKKIILLLLALLLLMQCTVLKRKYTRGFYIDFIPKKNTFSKNFCKKESSLVAYKNIIHDTLILNSKQHTIYNNQEDNTIITSHNSNFFSINCSHQNDIKVKSNLNVSSANIKCSKNNDESSNTQKSMFKLITWSTINLLIFILVYSVLYNHLLEIFLSTGGALIYGCYLVFIPTIISIIGLVFCFVHYYSILRNPESTKKQKIWAHIIITLAILLHPIMVFVYANLIIII